MLGRCMSESETVPIKALETAVVEYCLAYVKAATETMWAEYVHHEKQAERKPANELGRQFMEAAQRLAADIRAKRDAGFFRQLERDASDVADFGLPFDRSRLPGRFFDGF